MMIHRGKHLIATTGLVFVLLVGCTEDTSRVFTSPYEQINWEQVGHYDAQFHVHPGLGAEEYDPHQTIDRYHEEGYKILAFSPHDYDVPDEYIAGIYPWTNMSHIYETIRDVENPTEGNSTYEEIANEPYENRDPVELGMVSIEGSELSSAHHMISLFNDYTESSDSEAESFREIQERGGIVYFAHPGRYVERWGLTEHWYIDMYKRFDVVIGQVIYNREDNHPEDRAFFDRIAHALGSDRPIWLFGEDDMHREENLGWNRNVILLENFEPGSLHPDIQDGSAPDVREALRSGCFYLWKPSAQYNRRAFDITNVEVPGTAVHLTVDNNDLVQEIRWRTHNPNINDTETIHYGPSISVSDVPEYSRFVRAEIQGEDGTIYTQPFYVD